MKYSRYLFYWACILFAQVLVAQDYSAAYINKELLKDANAVIREQEQTFTVLDTGKAEYTEHKVITILNKNGDQFAEFYDSYDKFDKITDIKGKIYDKDGKLIRKIKPAEFIDHSAISDFSLFEDNRIKYCIPVINTYPYTVEYENSGILNGFINYHHWVPQHSFDLAVEHSSYTITIPKKFNIRFKKLNYTQEPSVSDFLENKIYTFEIKDLHAIEKENLSPGIQDIVPIVYAIPEYFKIEDYSGCNNNWKNFGYWIQILNIQENNLSDKTKTDLAEIQKKAVDRVDLIKRVYEYMQSKTRYVSIQLGIGGWRPFDASIVDKYGYGDCKALSNYMKTLLNYAGVEAIYTLAHAGENANDIHFDETFNQFNHAILCVPTKTDTIWLECTNQMIPFGFLGDFTDNRHVLLITPQGGKLVKTPAYTKEQNTLSRKAEMLLTPEGDANGTVQTRFSGLQYDDNVGLIYATPDKKKERLYKKIDLPSFVIKDFKLEEKKERIPWMDEQLTLEVSKYAATMANRLFLPLNLLNKTTAISLVMKERKTRLRLRYAYIDSDTIIYHLPQGYHVEFMPKPSEIKSEFGVYHANAIESTDKQSLTYTRTLTMTDGLFPPEKYKDYVAFRKEISKQDNVKVSLIKAP